MGLYFQILASGSKGNAILVCSEKTRLLVDAGLSGKEIVTRLGKTPVNGRQLNALLVSHEHQDHIRGVGVLSRRFDLPVYATPGTLEGFPPTEARMAQVHLFQAGSSFSIGDLHIQAFSISHDARDPVAFVIQNGGKRLGVCTDLGVATHLVRTRLQNCHGLIIEANHDTELLLNGPYPPHLKQRIRSRHGHLSNNDTCELLQTLFHEDLKAVAFAHLSEINNHPNLVKSMYRQFAASPLWEQVRFRIGMQHEVSEGVELT
ncbi:MAG: MBL fold metallo-hydrolase [Deltaproteobacteria bacterium]|nr:MBL fold metallo-hydrolase [Deltaproteobacteria bacterium]